MTSKSKEFVGFAGTSVFARGSFPDVARAAKLRLDGGEHQRIAMFDDASGQVVDIDYSGSLDDDVARLAAHPMAPKQAAEARRGPGRPKLGVVSREVSLLPRHWEWLSSQRGGASAGIRRLVEIARKEISHQDPVRKAVETAYAFLSDLAGDYPGFEEASRALFAHDFAAFEVIIADWPPDVREQLGRFLARA